MTQLVWCKLQDTTHASGTPHTSIYNVSEWTNFGVKLGTAMRFGVNLYDINLTSQIVAEFCAKMSSGRLEVWHSKLIHTSETESVASIKQGIGKLLEFKYCDEQGAGLF